MEGRRAHPEEKQGPASGIEKLPRSQRHQHATVRGAVKDKPPLAVAAPSLQKVRGGSFKRLLMRRWPTCWKSAD